MSSGWGAEEGTVVQPPTGILGSALRSLPGVGSKNENEREGDSKVEADRVMGRV